MLQTFALGMGKHVYLGKESEPHQCSSIPEQDILINSQGTPKDVVVWQFLVSLMLIHQFESQEERNKI